MQDRLKENLGAAHITLTPDKLKEINGSLAEIEIDEGMGIDIALLGALIILIAGVLYFQLMEND